MKELSWNDCSRKKLIKTNTSRKMFKLDVTYYNRKELQMSENNHFLNSLLFKNGMVLKYEQHSSVITWVTVGHQIYGIKTSNFSMEVHHTNIFHAYLSTMHT